MFGKMQKFCLALVLSLASLGVSAAVITTADWFVAGVDDGSADFRVTEVFTSAAELGGTDNRYVYSVTNLTSNLSAKLLRIANPNNDPRTSLSGPSSWAERVGSQNFIWEAGVPADYIDPGETLGGMQLLTSATLPSLTSPPLGSRAMGWIYAEDSSGARVDVFGPFPRDGSSSTAVSESGSLGLLSLGLLAIFVRRSFRA